jgi:hypothetical protein
MLCIQIKMKKNIVIALSLMLFATLALATPIALAAFNAHIPSNQGTGIVNELDGCRPPANAPSVNIDGDFPEALGGPIWAGAYCCASNHIDEDSGYPTPNQCCNPPAATGIYVPGNHCLCFQLRGFAPLS